MKFVKKGNGSVTVIGRGKSGRTEIVGNLPSIPEPKTPQDVPNMNNLSFPPSGDSGGARKPKYEYHPDIISVAEELAKRNSEGLDVHQVRNLLFFGGKPQDSRNSRTPQVSKEEWNTFLNKISMALQNPHRGNPLSGDDLIKFEKSLKVLQESYDAIPNEQRYNLIKLPSRLRYAYYALEREYISAALFKKPSPSNEEVRSLIDYHRNYYYGLVKELRPEIPEEYKRAFYRSAAGLPKDNGTVYAFHKVENMKFSGGTYDAGAVFVAFDTETSGISTADGEILQIGYGIYNSEGELLEKSSHYIRPNKTDESGKCYIGGESAYKVHGITPEMVENAPTFPEVWEEVAPKLQGSVIVGHNISFDLKHLRNQFETHGMKNIDGNPLSTSDIWWGEVDTLKHTRRHVSGVENYKLTTLSKHYNIPLVNAHDAADDAVASGDLFFKIRNSSAGPE